MRILLLEPKYGGGAGQHLGGGLCPRPPRPHCRIASGYRVVSYQLGRIVIDRRCEHRLRLSELRPSNANQSCSQSGARGEYTPGLPPSASPSAITEKIGVEPRERTRIDD